MMYASGVKMRIQLVHISVFVSAMYTTLATVDFPEDLAVPENTLVNRKSFTGKYNHVTTMNTTIVMPYSKIPLESPERNSPDRRYRMGYDGYVSCFKMFASFNEPVKLSIWRWAETPWTEDWYDDSEDMEHRSDLMKNGSYTLVYMSEAILLPLGESSYCISEAIDVEEHDFLGLTYGAINPIPYDKDVYCQNDMINLMQTCELEACVPDTEHTSWGSFDGDYNSRYNFEEKQLHHFRALETTCRNYAVQAIITEKMYDDKYSECKMIQLTDQEQPYTMKSHGGSVDSSDESELNDCWIVRAVDTSSMIHIQPVTMDLEHKTNDYCVYERLTITDIGSSESVDYCGNMTTTFVSTGAYCMVYFHRDTLEEYGGFTITFRSVPATMYREYTNDNNYIWPWDRVTEPPPPTSTTPLPEVGFFAKLTMMEKIGVGIGIAAACLVLLLVIGIVAYCVYQSTVNKQKKVHPTTTTLPKNKEYTSRRGVSYSRDPHYEPAIYTIPTSRHPPPYSLQPLSQSTPRWSSPPPPYTEERYRPSTKRVPVEDENAMKLPAQISLPGPEVTPVARFKRYRVDATEDKEEEAALYTLPLAVRKHQPYTSGHEKYGPYRYPIDAIEETEEVEEEESEYELSVSGNRGPTFAGVNWKYGAYAEDSD